MRRHALKIVALAAVAIAVACSDIPSGPESGLTEIRGADGAIVAGTCTTLGDLNDKARAVFNTGSPNVSSVLGKLKSLDQDVQKGRLAAAAERAHEIVGFTLKHVQSGNLSASEADIAAFVNAVYCYAGIDIDINQPSNSHLILPSDAAQVILSVDSKAGIAFEANPVAEPTMIEFQQLPDTFSTPGAGPLDTKLDQYAGFLTITKSSETNAALTKPAVVGICADGVIPQEVRDRLRLGHGKSTGFELAAPADAGFLECENLTDPVPVIGTLGKLARLFMPKELHARSAAYFIGGGIGGTVTEFSPFAPVDPELRSGGGIGGTVTEFIRSPMAGSLRSADMLMPFETICTTITATTGTSVDPNCRPFARFTTRLGTVLTGVPVTWQVTEGGGLVSGLSAEECGAFASMVMHPTDMFGRSSICWKLGAEGLNRVTATPAAGGDAPAGVTFVPASVSFDAQATPVVVGPPTHIEIVEGAGQTGPAGHPTPVAPKVRVTDSAGHPVPGVPVWFLVREGSGSVSAERVLTDAQGKASVVWTLGVGANQLKAYIDEPPVFAFVYFEATGTAAP
ncbi:MAG TPA: Ig-like domain-containing protein [Gemmatimonadaceae bacterium]|nr:Ig-like domain-containing protein [Gemmatimonadaceae bacterium]